MSNFNNASLIITPNYYKAGKLYSIKPTSGAGDLDVVRATSATRVNEQGLVEIPRTNLCLQSEVFTNGWTLESSTISANTTIAPNGTLTADTLSEVFANDVHRTYRTAITTIVGQNYAFSFYVKKDTSRYVRLSVVQNSATNVWSAVQFDLDTKTFTSGVGSAGGTFVNASILELADGWFRISMTGTATSTSTFFMLSLSNGSAILSSDSRGCVAYSGNTANKIIIWGAQLEEGITATEYIPTTSVIRTRFAGITQDGGSASNIPRLDYTNGSCPSILVEPQRTNLNLWSEDLTNIYWSKFQSSVIGNAAIAPSGNMTADKIVENTTNNAHSVFLGGLFSSIGQSLTRSVYLKADGRSWAVLAIQESGVFHRAYFNLSNGTIGNVGSGVTASIEPAANGYYKCTITRVLTTTDPSSFAIELASANGTNTYLGNGTSGIFVWGAQIEAGANATSYIPTTTTSVTRNADVISKSGISNLIGQSQGSLVYYFIKNSNNSIPSISLSNNGTNPRFYPFESGTNYIFFLQAASAILVSYPYPLSNFITGLNKIGITYGAGSFKIYVNGSLITSVPYTEQNLSFSKLNIGSSNNDGGVGNTSNNLVLINKEILSESEMIQLTTL